MATSLTDVFLAHRDLVFGYILARTRDLAVADDVFQEVSVSILEEQRQESIQDPVPWIMTVAKRRIADHFRQQVQRRTVEQVSGEAADIVDTAFDEAAAQNDGIDEARLSFLRTCLQRLATRARSIVDARYRHQQPIAAIAAAIGWKEGAVRVALAKARSALADCVERRLRAKGGSP